ncbi:M42 family metallopeptidase [Dethiobacter alkaliphilus]|uniref:Peptidase M42 family protein n=1 Tax=Dethiobacter alkaliphilus AHT 1 TaxID=555088 RepID=C0GHP7_DETAL|nr:M42 family metallopeptidase [Dethiobacter alkaliphilus]EEG77253.1 peptidase M42 family protein [Dethiobacter alkaliphilus AHT 1]
MLLKKLTEAYGVSGDENDVRQILKEELTPIAEEITTDTLGNLYVKKGIGRKPRVMLASHMDEIGLMVVGFEKSGLLRVTKVGGIDNRVLVSKAVVVGKRRIPGVIGAKAVHLQKPNERKKAINIDNLYIDIGVRSQDEAEKMVQVGDYVAFSATTREAGDNCLIGKAFDNRAGCAILAELLKEDLDLELTGVFTVQEEVGLRGAGVAAYSVHPDIALIIESTSASDVMDTKEAAHVTTLGGGPAVTLMDSSFIAPQYMVDLVVGTAEKLDIPFQFRRLTTAGTDAGKIHQTHAGISSAVIAVPCRYIHSPASIISQEDYQNTLRLAKGILNAIAEGGLPHEGSA